MLGAAPNHLTVPEAIFKWSLFRVLDGVRINAAGARDLLARSWQFGVWDVPLSDLDLPERGDVAYVELMHRLVALHANRRGLAVPDVWIDHTPGNIRYVPTLAAVSRDPAFVHVVRDGRAVLSSVKDLSWGPNSATDAAGWWATHVAQGLAAQRRPPPNARVATVRFEDLVVSPEETLHDLCALLDLRFSPAMVSGGRGYELPAYTEDQHRLVNGEVRPDRVDAWKRALLPREIEIFEAATGELLSLLGYAPLFGAAARPATRLERARSRVAHIGRRVASDLWRRGRMERTGRRTPNRRLREDT